VTAAYSAYTSHYNRKDKIVKYLPPVFNFNEIYGLYKEQYTNDQKVACFSTVHFSLICSVYPVPLKMTCNWCDAFKRQVKLHQVIPDVLQEQKLLHRKVDSQREGEKKMKNTTETK
jgi:hypothetical protein